MQGETKIEIYYTILWYGVALCCAVLCCVVLCCVVLCCVVLCCVVLCCVVLCCVVLCCCFVVLLWLCVVWRGLVELGHLGSKNGSKTIFPNLIGDHRGWWQLCLETIGDNERPLSARLCICELPNALKMGRFETANGSKIGRGLDRVGPGRAGCIWL